MDKSIKPTSRNLRILSNAIKETILLRDKNNPLKGECYIASAFLYDLVGGKQVSLYKILDCNNQYHWCIKLLITGEIFDITGDQYSLENLPVPTFYNNGEIKSSKMGYTSYKKRIMRLELEFEEFIKINPLELDL